MASEFDVYSFVKGQFGVEIIGQGKNGTYDTVHLYIQPFSKNNDRLAIDEYVGRYAETPSWSKIFTLSENDLSDAIKIYNNYVVSSDRINIHMIDKEIYKEVKMRLNDVFEIKESVRFDYDEYTGIHSSVVNDYYIFSYAPIDYDDLSGWEITDVDGNLYIRESWEDMSDKEIADSISKFEKFVKKYTDDSDTKVIIKDFHEKIRM